MFSNILLILDLLLLFFVLFGSCEIERPTWNLKIISSVTAFRLWRATGVVPWWIQWRRLPLEPED